MIFDSRRGRGSISCERCELVSRAASRCPYGCKLGGRNGICIPQADAQNDVYFPQIFDTARSNILDP